MKFIDKVHIYVEAGKGGDGVVAFRREAYVPKGGPAGGDGGKGGSIIFEATTSLSTLLDFRYHREYKAKSGGQGMAKKMHGADGAAVEAMRRAFESVNIKGEVVERPKALGDIRGVTYIYGMFYRFGLINVPDEVKEKMKHPQNRNK